jgi:arylsulfatase A-like enzyme
MAESFAAEGYDTWALVKIPHLDPRFGFDQGFAFYERRPVADGRLARDALALAVEPRERPFFGYVHLLGCHYPYQPRWRSPEYMRTYGGDYPEAERAAAGIDFTTHRIKDRIEEGELTLEAADVEFLNLIYEATLRRFDERAIEPLLEGLRQRGVYDETLIVLTADHGEELYEHGGYGHGHALWEEVVRVPLIVKFPRGRRPAALGDRWSGLSRAIDLYPSLARASRVAVPRGLAGQDLFGGSAPELALAEVGGGWAFWRRADKLVFREGLPPRLFDLAADPGETTNLAAERSGRVEELRQASVRYRYDNPPPRLAPYEWRAEPLPAEAVETLKSLGYVD